jgi:SHS2 domain-containing protein
MNTERGHAVLSHTADVGLSARARTLPELFGEAAVALAELVANVPAGTPAETSEVVELVASDLDALAYAWLNELIGLADAQRVAVVDVEIERLAAQVPPADSWLLRAHVGLHALGSAGVEPRSQPKSATYHRLAVRQVDEGWTMEVYLDV